MYTRFLKFQRVTRNFRHTKNKFSTNEEEVRTFLRKTIRVLDRDLVVLEEKFPSLYSHSVANAYFPVFLFLRNTVNIRDRGMTITFKNCPSVFIADVQEQLEPRFLYLKSCSNAAGKQTFPWHIHIQNSPDILIESEDRIEERSFAILSDGSAE